MKNDINPIMQNIKKINNNMIEIEGDDDDDDDFFFEEVFLFQWYDW
jgi:hypothetical protein